jgi:hypothetical protein
MCLCTASFRQYSFPPSWPGPRRFSLFLPYTVCTLGLFCALFLCVFRLKVEATGKDAGSAVNAGISGLLVAICSVFFVLWALAVVMESRARFAGYRLRKKQEEATAAVTVTGGAQAPGLVQRVRGIVAALTLKRSMGSRGPCSDSASNSESLGDGTGTGCYRDQRAVNSAPSVTPAATKAEPLFSHVNPLRQAVAAPHQGVTMVEPVQDGHLCSPSSFTTASDISSAARRSILVAASLPPLSAGQSAATAVPSRRLSRPAQALQSIAQRVRLARGGRPGTRVRLEADPQ